MMPRMTLDLSAYIKRTIRQAENLAINPHEEETLWGRRSIGFYESTLETKGQRGRRPAP
jgi:hypothetical protein